MKAKAISAPKLNKKGKPRYRGSHKALVVNLIIVVVLAVFTGFMIGMWYISNQAPFDDSIYNIKVDTLLDDVEPIKAEALTKTPKQLGATKSCIVAFDNTFAIENVEMISKGSVNAAGVNQSIDAWAIRCGDEMFLQKITLSSMVKAADRFYQKDGVVTQVDGDIRSNTVVFNGREDKRTLAEFAEWNGASINTYIQYIVSSKTVKEATTVQDDEDGNYTFTLKLDPIKSVINYVKNMKSSGGLSNYPIFSSPIELIVTIDGNYRLVKVTANESYTAKLSVGGLPITAKGSGSLTSTFRYNGEFAIPPKTENASI